MHSCAWLMAPRCSGRCHPDNVAPSQSRVVVTSVARRCTTEFSISLAPSLVVTRRTRWAQPVHPSRAVRVAGGDRRVRTDLL